jgi:CHAT domain-containing protein/Tfp pilus assembly protein PilF
MRDELDGKNEYKDKEKHPDRNSMVGYVTGSCSSESRKVIEEHCLDCLECRTQLSILLHLIISSPGAEEHRKFTDLLSLGEEAAARARSIIIQQQEQSQNLAGASLAKTIWSRKIIAAPALIIALLVCASLFGYFISSRQSLEERMHTRVRDIYQNTRLLQARVTGGFAHQNYIVTRGSGENTGVDETQRIALLAEINQEVHTRPKAATRHILGKLLMLQGDLEPAEQQFQLALKEAPRNAQLNADMGALYYERSLKKEHEDRELLEKAAEYSTNAVEIEPKLSESWFNRALCYEEMNLPYQAASDWEQYLALDHNSAWADEARSHLEKLQKRKAHLEKQEQSVPAEFLAAAAAGDKPMMRELIIRNFVAVQYLAMNQIFDKYLSAAISGEKNESDQHLRTLRLIGGLISEIKGDRFVGDAVDFIARGNPAVKRDVQAIRQTLEQARGEYTRGNIGAASALYKKARNAAELIQDHCHAEIAALGLARPYRTEDESEDLIALRKRLIIDSERRFHRQMHAQSLLALANVEGGAQQLSLNLEHSNQSAEIAKEIGDTQTAINSLRFVAFAYESLGDYDLALKKRYEAISLIRDFPVSPHLRAVVYNGIGDTLSQVGRYPAALHYQHEAVWSSEQSGNIPISVYMTQRLGLIYGMLGKHEMARRHLDHAIARAETVSDRIARKQLLLDLYTNYGNFYTKQNRPGEAIAIYQRAIENLGKSENRFHLSSIHQGLASAYLALGQNEEAEKQLQTSIDLIEQAREQIDDARSRGTFLASQQNIYRAMADFQFFKKNDHRRAFNYAEIAKARDLLDTLAGSPEINTNDGQIKLAVTSSATPLTIEQVQRALPLNTQLVQYVIGKENLMIWLVRRDRLTTANANVSAEKLRGKVAAYLDELRKRGNIEGLNSQASELYQWLIAPIIKQLDPNSELCIVPDGLLQNLPFAALVSPETKRYLVEDYSLVTNPSASVFARTLELSCDKQVRGSGSFLGLANPSFNRQRFPKLNPLPSSDEEIERIRSHYRAARILSRGQATESALANQIGKYEIVHLATHALSDKQSSLLSAIVLADDGNRQGDQNPGRVALDGALRAHEIYRLKPERTRLVVLSSCSSGLGDQTRNEAMGGLAQAFLVAGVPTVVASLWEIDDESTAGLMEKLHAAHRIKRLAFGQSLRQAQISYLQSAPVRRRHPYFWATFIVTGNGLTT